ncbi:lysine-ketoglutarate reductase/saccharopine dehydrogenase-like protein (TIGR00300 family) [Methanococcus voltae]|uniref:Ornithine cyclodeaminase n=2 Tax=Methanococcus voltae TaxID=2188 RepID=A0A8J7RGI8_METVO|nr:TIGR00300 family protein [Methanococcus voltae]MBP2201457.1 lysine-ketoglutarate reductase/saccharopine dehydrogenase-like protein (TIGR00300 family) [Methanococcus voltae]MCS3922246.1 lysine-ketoglutarate reductase/saccharopine dehydrogenase-like protein (TIGR00300 family) [Methanococcus voltae PS]
MFMREIELKGHIVDSMIMTKVFDTTLELGGDYKVLEFDIGKEKTDPSYAKLLIISNESQQHLESILEELQNIGADIPEVQDVNLKQAEKDQCLPKGFYSTTNHQTFVKLNGEWISVQHPKMDAVITVDPVAKTAETKVIRKIKAGDYVVVGHSGIRIVPPEKPRDAGQLFEFMNSEVSSEKPKEAIIRKIAKEMFEIKQEYQKNLKEGKKEGGIAIVGGPAIIHTGGGEALAKLVEMGYVQGLLAGNALATHDIESVLYGTSLGINIESANPVVGGHKHHIYAINDVNKAGSIRNAVEQGIITKGIMYECIKNDVPYILAGSIRDDGPLPDVVTDSVEAQDIMRSMVMDKKMVIMMATLLHSIATGNLMPSSVKTVCVDILPATVTKLMDRGTSQAIGVVTDIGVFLVLLAKELEKLENEHNSKK